MLVTRVAQRRDLAEHVHAFGALLGVGERLESAVRTAPRSRPLRGDAQPPEDQVVELARLSSAGTRGRAVLDARREEVAANGV